MTNKQIERLPKIKPEKLPENFTSRLQYFDPVAFYKGCYKVFTAETALSIMGYGAAPFNVYCVETDVGPSKRTASMIIINSGFKDKEKIWHERIQNYTVTKKKAVLDAVNFLTDDSAFEELIPELIENNELDEYTEYIRKHKGDLEEWFSLIDYYK